MKVLCILASVVALVFLAISLFPPTSVSQPAPCECEETNCGTDWTPEGQAVQTPNNAFPDVFQAHTTNSARCNSTSSAEMPFSKLPFEDNADCEEVAPAQLQVCYAKEFTDDGGDSTDYCLDHVWEPTIEGTWWGWLVDCCGSTSNGALEGQLCWYAKISNPDGPCDSYTIMFNELHSMTYTQSGLVTCGSEFEPDGDDNTKQETPTLKMASANSGTQGCPCNSEGKAVKLELAFRHTYINSQNTPRVGEESGATIHVKEESYECNVIEPPNCP